MSYAEEQGIDKQKVIDALLEKEKERITTWVDQPGKKLADRHLADGNR